MVMKSLFYTLPLPEVQISIRKGWAVGRRGASMVIIYAAFIAGKWEAWLASPDTPGFYFILSVLNAAAWCRVIIMLYVGMRFLDFSNKLLKYGLEAMLSFYMFHHPVIVAIVSFVVQWQTGVLVLEVVAPRAFVVTLGLTEMVRRVGPLRCCSA